MNIGILQSAGIAGNIIDAALNHPEQQEVFTPVIYSKENGNDKNVSSDLKFGNISAVVVAPGSATAFNFPGTMTVFVDDNLRVATLMEGVNADGDTVAEPSALDADFITERIKKAWQSVHRDFLCSSPRVALLTAAQNPSNEQLMTIVTELASQGVGIFGPYDAEEFVEQQHHLHFDLTLAFDGEVTKMVLDALSQPTRTRLLAGLPMVMALTDYTADTLPAEAENVSPADLAEPALALRQAVYTVMTVCKNRAAYDKAHHDPLPKIYHERKDDSEKIRFAVKKPI